MKSLTFVLALAAVAACRSSTAPAPAAQQVPGADVTLALGDTATLGDTGLRVAFHEVTEDSRCPIDAVCVWAGNAQIALDVIAPSQPPKRHLLNTTQGDKEAVAGNYLIQFIELDPAPQSNQPTPAYQARLRWRSLLD